MFLTFYIFKKSISWQKDILWVLYNFDLWAKCICAHLTHMSVACPVLSSRLSAYTTLCAWECAFSVKFGIDINRTFGVFEWASPCLVSFPSPESSKGPSIRGQAAVTASLPLSPCSTGAWAGGEWCTDHRVGHGTCDPPPLPPQFSPSCVGHRSPCHVLLLLL